MKIRIRSALLALLTTAVAAIGLATNAQAASAPSTPVRLSPAQVAQALFVAGDVTRLSQIPSGTEDVVLEKVLQQLYVENPTLDPGQATSDIHGLRGRPYLERTASDLGLDADRDGRQPAGARDPSRARPTQTSGAEVDHALAQVDRPRADRRLAVDGDARPGIRRLGGLT